MKTLIAAVAKAEASLWSALAASFVYVVATLPGVPALRQDWFYPFLLGWRQVVAVGYSGWTPDGIGAPVPYPSGYALSLPIGIASLLFGKEGALVLFLLATGALCAFGARAIARDAGCNAAGSSAAAIFAVLNPWTYTELAAGHTFMLLAYAGSIWLLRETLAEKPRPFVLAAGALLTLEQLQFFLVSTVLLVITAVRRRLWWPLILVAVAWLPMAIGIVADRSTLDAVPFLLSWERNQSIAPVDALQFTGYFAQYAEGFGGVFSIPAFVTLALALVALARRERRTWSVAAGTLAALLLAMGTRGPLAIAFTWAVEHVTVIGLVRELFDVLAYAAIGYVVLAARTCGRYRAAGWVWLLAALLLPIAWLASPASRLWVAAQTLPGTVVPDIQNARFALLPAFQPMDFRARGSGPDPDAYARSKNVTPLNAYLVGYPADAALAAFSRNGDTRPLEALSVASVIERPWLRSRRDALAQQWALPISTTRAPRAAETLRLRFAPELALLPMPAVGTLDARFGAGNVFFGDAEAAEGAVPAAWHRFAPVTRVSAPNVETHASRAWVDARLAFAERPDLAQPLGGALTTNGRAQLPVRGGVSALADVEGSLRASDGSVVTESTHGYRWIAIPQSVRRVVCRGLCVVAAQGAPPPLPLEPPPRAPRALDFHAVTPWLVVARVPAGKGGALRYNVAYDTDWRAYLGGERLAHVRLDGIVNGWLVPARSDARPLLLIEMTAAAQFAAALFATLVIAAAICWSLWRRSIA